jgi:hypothetical protein
LHSRLEQRRAEAAQEHQKSAHRVEASTDSLPLARPNEVCGRDRGSYQFLCVNKHRSVTPPMSNGSAAYRADRRRNPAPININGPYAAIEALAGAMRLL